MSLATFLRNLTAPIRGGFLNAIDRDPYSKPMSTTTTEPKLPALLVATAAKEDGVEEINGTNCGPRVNQFKAATVLPSTEEWPWCAAFVCFVVREAMKAAGIKETATFKRPTTASAWGLRAWAVKQDNTVRTKDSPGDDIKPGDLIGYTFSHCGIAASKPDRDGNFYCWEGNTDGAGSREGGIVLKKKRHKSKVKFRLRFTV